VYTTISRGSRWFLWKSVDRGASWRRLAQNTLPGDSAWKNVDRGASSRRLGRNTLLTGDGHPLAAGASDPDTVYVAGRSGLATSTDGGATWHDAGLAGTRITAIAVHPQLADTVYAGTTAGLFTSTNAGQTWQRVRDDLAQARVTAVATDPEQGGRVYAATTNGIFWSDNSGQNWNRFDTRLPPRTFHVLAATRSGLVYAGSYNGGGIVQLRTPASAPQALNTTSRKVAPVPANAARNPSTWRYAPATRTRCPSQHPQQACPDVSVRRRHDVVRVGGEGGRSILLPPSI
jgi:hypothetical protein